MGRMLEIVVSPNQTILINDHSLKANENGLIKVDVEDIIVQENRGLLQFDYAVDNEKMLSKLQRIMFYELIVDWNQFGKLDLIGHIGVDRECVHKVVTLACINRVLVKAGHQWKARKEMKDAIKALITRLTQSEAPRIQTIFEEHEEVKSDESIQIKDVNAISEADIPKRKIVVKKERAMNIPKKKK